MEDHTLDKIQISNPTLGKIQIEVLKYLFKNGNSLIQHIEYDRNDNYQGIRSDYKTIFNAVKRLQELKLVEEKGEEKTKKGRFFPTYGLTEKGFAISLLTLKLGNEEIKEGIIQRKENNDKILDMWKILQNSLREEKAINFIKQTAAIYNYLGAKKINDRTIIISVINSVVSSLSEEDRDKFMAGVFDFFKENKEVKGLKAIYELGKTYSKDDSNQKNNNLTSKILKGE